MTKPVRSSADQVGDEALRAATGRGRVEWHAVLDAAGAQGWDHAAIARHLVEAHGVDGWWAQGVTIGYEQARGLRVPGQRPDGSFEASASVTVRAVPAAIWPSLADAEQRAAWVGREVEVRGETAERSVRWAFADDTRITVRLDAIDEARTRVAVQHARLAGPEELAAAKDFWRAALARLRDAV